MPRKIEEAERAKPFGSVLRLAQEPNGGERLLTERETANLLRLSTVAGEGSHEGRRPAVREAWPIRSLSRERSR
jgi:hypothetical protein